MEDSFLFIAFIWLVSSLIIGAGGKSTEEGFWSIFLISLFLSPIIGGILLIASRNKKDVEFQNNLLNELKAIRESQSETADTLKKLKDILRN